ncbi:MAG: HU family DNA-binding protein [Deltaproteobacteria bacterium]|nr:MAG: HU family DNA-binding protein [Deltaproteobacteria bacterium]
MTKQELIDRIYRTRGLPNGVTKKAVKEIVDGVFSELSDYFVKSKVTRNQTPKFTYPGFGTFVKKKRAERNGRNPRNGAPIKIPAMRTLSFTASADLKAVMNADKK